MTKFSQYEGGVKVKDNTTWAFTGYRKLAWTSSGSLSKTLVCFKAGTKSAQPSTCNSTDTATSCCVAKSSQDIEGWPQANITALKASVDNLVDANLKSDVTMKDRLFGW